MSNEPTKTLSDPNDVVAFEVGFRWAFWRNAAGVGAVSCRGRMRYPTDPPRGTLTVTAVNRAQGHVTFAGAPAPDLATFARVAGVRAGKTMAMTPALGAPNRAARRRAAKRGGR